MSVNCIDGYAERRKEERGRGLSTATHDTDVDFIALAILLPRVEGVIYGCKSTPLGCSEGFPPRRCVEGPRLLEEASSSCGGKVGERS